MLSRGDVVDVAVGGDVVVGADGAKTDSSRYSNSSLISSMPKTKASKSLAILFLKANC